MNFNRCLSVFFSPEIPGYFWKSPEKRRAAVISRTKSSRASRFLPVFQLLQHGVEPLCVCRKTLVFIREYLSRQLQIKFVPVFRHAPNHHLSVRPRAPLNPKQIGVCACAVEVKLSPALAIDQQPVRLNVAFPVACIVPGQIVVCVLWRQGSGYAECVNDLLELSHLPAAFHTGLKVFLEFRGVPYLKHFSALRQLGKELFCRAAEPVATAAVQLGKGFQRVSVRRFVRDCCPLQV